MLPLPDGTFRYSPRDLVAYLEGDVATWCERMFAGHQRDAAGGPAELEWATPYKGDEHERRWLSRQPGGAGTSAY